MKKHILLLCSTLLCVSNAHGVETELLPSHNEKIEDTAFPFPSAPSIDLKAALSSAYNTNENIKIAQQTFLTEAEAFPRALSSFLPDVSMSISSTRAKQTNVSRFATGSAENGPDVSRNLQVQQNLFNGGRSAYNIKMAQAGFEVSKATLYSSEQKTLTDASSIYLGLWGAETKYNIALEAVEFNAQNLNMVREKKNVGNATITDLAAAEAQLAKAHSDKSQQFANLMAARTAFQTVIGVDASNLSLPSVPDDMPENLDAFKAVVEKSNFDLMAAKSSLGRSKDGVRLSQGALLPQADLAVSAGRNYYNPESNSRANYRAISTTVSVKIPILSRGGVDHSVVREAKYKSRQAVYGLDFTRKQVLANVISNWEGFLSMKDAVRSAEEAIKAQTLALEGVKSGYEVGTQTMLDVLQQQDKLNQLKSQVVDVKTQYLKSAYQLKSLMGQMTAQKLHLDAKYFYPEVEFRNLKHKIVGF